MPRIYIASPDYVKLSHSEICTLLALIDDTEGPFSAEELGAIDTLRRIRMKMEEKYARRGGRTETTGREN